MTAADDLQATGLGAPGIQAGEGPVFVGGSEEDRVRKSVINALATCSIGLKRLPPAVEYHSPRIDQSPAVDLKAPGAGVVGPEPPPVEPAGAVERFYVGADVVALQHVEEPAGPPAQAVQGVVGILGSESGKKDLPVIGPAIPVTIVEMKEFLSVSDIGASVSVGQDSSRDDELVVVDGRLVGRPIAVRVLEDQDPVAGILVHVQLRIGLAAGDPESPLAVEGDLGGLGQQGISGPEVYLKSIGHLEGRLLDLRVRWRNIPQVALGEGGQAQAAESQRNEEDARVHLSAFSCSRIRSSCPDTKGSNFSGSVWAVACSFFRSP